MVIESRNRPILFPTTGKKFIFLILGLAIVAGLLAYRYFNFVFEANVIQTGRLYLPENADFGQVEDSLRAGNFLKKYNAFRWVSKKKEYRDRIKPGCYLLKEGMNTNQLVNMLRGGMQEPVKVTFNNVRFPEQFAAKIGSQLAIDSTYFAQIYFTPEIYEKYGFTKENFSAMFIPNTYEFYWTTSPARFFERMNAEYKRFWNGERIEKANAIGLTPVEVSVLASIVQEETIKEEEKPRVAGVYINRLKRGYPLQADPTVKFAVGDFSITRVLNGHLEMDSPYNTYKYKGLPPGPINFPSIQSIDAVLNYEKHKFLYFCAKNDFSGYHVFARSLREHNKNADRYRKALNQRKIYK